MRFCRQRIWDCSTKFCRQCTWEFCRKCTWDSEDNIPEIARWDSADNVPETAQWDSVANISEITQWDYADNIPAIAQWDSADNIAIVLSSEILKSWLFLFLSVRGIRIISKLVNRYQIQFNHTTSINSSSITETIVGNLFKFWFLGFNFLNVWKLR